MQARETDPALTCREGSSRWSFTVVSQTARASHILSLEFGADSPPHCGISMTPRQPIDIHKAGNCEVGISTSPHVCELLMSSSVGSAEWPSKVKRRDIVSLTHSCHKRREVVGQKEGFCSAGPMMQKWVHYSCLSKVWPMSSLPTSQLERQASDLH